MPPKALQHPQRRKMLIYGGMAAALLLVFLISRRGSSSSASDQAAPTAQPVSNPAVDPSSLGGGASGVDDSAELAAIDTDINTLGGAVASMQGSAQTPGGDTPGTTGTLDLPGIITALGGVFGAGVAAGSPKITVSAPKQPGPGNTKPKKPPTKPKSPPKPPPKPAPKPTRRKGP